MCGECETRSDVLFDFKEYRDERLVILEGIARRVDDRDNHHWMIEDRNKCERMSDFARVVFEKQKMPGYM